MHRWIVADIERRSGDPETAIHLAVHSGDMYERKSTPRERLAAAGFVQGLTDWCPVLIVRGNHDAIDDLPLLARLEPSGPSFLHRIVVEEEASVHSLGGVAVAAVAWPRKAALLAAVGATGKEAGEQAASGALRDVLRGLGSQLAEHEGPRLLVMHAMVRNSVTSTGQPLVGMDMEIGLEDLALVRADAYALGHIHKGQAWEIVGAPVIYPGSPRRTAFGELEPKGYVIIEIDDEMVLEDGTHPTTWTFVETPCTPMVQIESTWADGLFDDGNQYIADAENGAEVRFRYRVSSDDRAAAKRAALEFRDEILAAGAISVKIEEEVIASASARAPEIAAAKTLSEKLTALRASRGDVLTEERRTRLEEKLARLEQEVAGG